MIYDFVLKQLTLTELTPEYFLKSLTTPNTKKTYETNDGLMWLTIYELKNQITLYLNKYPETEDTERLTNMQKITQAIWDDPDSAKHMIDEVIDGLADWFKHLDVTKVYSDDKKSLSNLILFMVRVLEHTFQNWPYLFKAVLYAKGVFKKLRPVDDLATSKSQKLFFSSEADKLHEAYNKHLEDTMLLVAACHELLKEHKDAFNTVKADSRYKLSTLRRLALTVHNTELEDPLAFFWQTFKEKSDFNHLIKTLALTEEQKATWQAAYETQFNPGGWTVGAILTMTPPRSTHITIEQIQQALQLTASKALISITGSDMKLTSLDAYDMLINHTDPKAMQANLDRLEEILAKDYSLPEPLDFDFDSFWTKVMILRSAKPENLSTVELKSHRQAIQNCIDKLQKYQLYQHQKVAHYTSLTKMHQTLQLAIDNGMHHSFCDAATLLRPLMEETHRIAAFYDLEEEYKVEDAQAKLTAADNKVTTAIRQLHEKLVDVNQCLVPTCDKVIHQIEQGLKAQSSKKDKLFRRCYSNYRLFFTKMGTHLSTTETSLHKVVLIQQTLRQLLNDPTSNDKSKAKALSLLTDTSKELLMGETMIESAIQTELK